jgi:hypothetical protein
VSALFPRMRVSSMNPSRCDWHVMSTMSRSATGLALSRPGRRIRQR